MRITIEVRQLDICGEVIGVKSRSAVATRGRDLRYLGGTYMAAWRVTITDPEHVGRRSFTVRTERGAVPAAIHVR